MSAHWTGDSHPPEIERFVTTWADRLAAMSARRRDVAGVRYTAARLPWIRVVLDGVAAHGALNALVRAAMGRTTAGRRRGEQPSARIT